MTEKTKHDLADDVAELVGDVLVDLQRLTGIPTECLLAGAYAQIIAMMAVHLGGAMTAKSCEHAAARVRDLSPHSAASLAFARPAGRA